MKTFMGNAKSLGPASIINVDDPRKFGKRDLPRAVFDYLEEAPRAKSLFETTCALFGRLLSDRGKLRIWEQPIRERKFGSTVVAASDTCAVGYS
jgi:hypothetical protein